MHSMTAAHRTLPLGTLVRVRHLGNNRKVDVRINDRGPFVRERERIIDLSYAAAQKLGVVGPARRRWSGSHRHGGRQPGDLYSGNFTSRSQRSATGER